MRHKWLNPANFALKLQGGEQHGAPTVIIDEASMIPMDLLGVLFRALDLNKVSRLILVGDPNQLPPIGPGRPFVDIIAWLEGDDERKKCLARLMERARHEDHDSQALQLADGYLRDDPTPGDDDMLSRVAREDVEAAIWRFAVLAGRAASWRSSLSASHEEAPERWTDDKKAYVAFNASLGLAEERRHARPGEGRALADPQPGAEPRVRHDRDQPARSRPSTGAGCCNYSTEEQASSPFGEQEIVWTDKVMQVDQPPHRRLVPQGQEVWITSPTARSASWCRHAQGQRQVGFDEGPVLDPAGVVLLLPPPGCGWATRTRLRPDGPQVPGQRLRHRVPDPAEERHRRSHGSCSTQG